ncbi:MAG: pilus assembly protein [Clostridiales bacterium]|jgi:hypothetical protein|nr:pilus assembly protein [Clostridiales bacterium]
MMLNAFENTNCKLRASVTVEAALSLPIFIFVLLTLAFLIQALRTHEMMHSSLTNAANTMALQYYAIADLNKVNDRNGGARKPLHIGGAPQNMNEFYSALESYNQEVSNDSFDVYKEYIDTDNKTVNPVNIEAFILKVWNMYEYIYSSGNTQPMSSDDGLQLFKYYLINELYKMGPYDAVEYDNRRKRIDEMMNRYNIIGGFDGIRFADLSATPPWRSDFPVPSFGNADSGYFTIKVRYDVKIPFPYQTIGKIPITHCIKARVWGVGA